jgi:hypothetical protein
MGPREVVVDMQEMRARDVARRIDQGPVLGIRELVADVEDDPRGVVEVALQLFRRDQQTFHLSS